MYKITWDKETGGVLLHSRIVEGTMGVSPRPVFYEELDLLRKLLQDKDTRKELREAIIRHFITPIERQ